MSSNIIFSANNNEDVIILPVVPEFDLDSPQNNERFETLNGTLNLIGNEGLKSFSITSIFPSQQYAWLKPGSVGDPSIYIDFFEKWRDRKVPFRVITSKKDGTEWFNMAVLIDNFQHRPRRNGDVAYSLEVSEYPFIGGK